MNPHSFENSGAFTSPADSRDFQDHKVREALGASALPVHKQSNIPDVSAVPVLYQGHTSACVPHSRTWAFHYKYYLKNQILLNLSPRFGYALDKSVDGAANQTGTFPRVDLLQFQKNGECELSYLPNDITLDEEQYKDISKVTNAADQSAMRYSNTDFIRVAVDADSIKAAIDDWQVVLACVQIGNEWWTSPEGTTSWLPKDILPVRPPKIVVSGHQIAIYGYDENEFYFVNSFGVGWGNGGLGTMVIEPYMPFIKECWAMEELPQEVVNTLKTVIQVVEPSTPVNQASISLLQKLINWLMGGPTPS